MHPKKNPLNGGATFHVGQNKEKTMEIKFDRNNYRRHSDRNKELIAKSLEECGAGRSILVDNDDEIIAGNGVYEQAKAQGIPVRVVETDGSELVVVKRTDLGRDDERRKRLALADNATADNVEWDGEALQADFGLDELTDWGINLDFGDEETPRQKIEDKGEMNADDFEDAMELKLRFTYSEMEYLRAECAKIDGNIETAILRKFGYEGD